MLKVKDITSKLKKSNYLMIFENDELIFDDSVGYLKDEILNREIKSMEYLEGSDISIDLKQSTLNARWN